MRAAVLLLVAFLAVAFAGPDRGVGRWENRTQSHLTTSNGQTPFSLSWPMVPAAGSPYHLEIHLDFAEVYDEVVVEMYTIRGDVATPLQYIIKDKGVKAVILLQDMTQSFNGWASENIDCGVVVGTVTCKSKIESVSAALKVIKPAPVKEDSCNHELHRPTPPHARVHVAVFLPVIIMTLLSFCCCLCCCVRARRCRREQCKPVEEAYPAEAVTAAVASEAAPEQELAGHAMYPFPVMAVPLDGSVQYALVPVNSINQ